MESNLNKRKLLFQRLTPIEANHVRASFLSKGGCIALSHDMPCPSDAAEQNQRLLLLLLM